MDGETYSGQGRSKKFAKVAAAKNALRAFIQMKDTVGFEYQTNYTNLSCSSTILQQIHPRPLLQPTTALAGAPAPPPPPSLSLPVVTMSPNLANVDFTSDDPIETNYIISEVNRFQSHNGHTAMMGYCPSSNNNGGNSILIMDTLPQQIALSNGTVEVVVPQINQQQDQPSKPEEAINGPINPTNGENGNESCTVVNGETTVVATAAVAVATPSEVATVRIVRTWRRSSSDSFSFTSDEATADSDQLRSYNLHFNNNNKKVIKKKKSKKRVETNEDDKNEDDDNDDNTEDDEDDLTSDEDTDDDDNDEDDDEEEALIRSIRLSLEHYMISDIKIQSKYFY